MGSIWSCSSRARNCNPAGPIRRGCASADTEPVLSFQFKHNWRPVHQKTPLAWRSERQISKLCVSFLLCYPFLPLWADMESRTGRALSRQRQKEWSVVAAGPSLGRRLDVSCHTGMTYLLARRCYERRWGRTSRRCTRRICANGLGFAARQREIDVSRVEEGTPADASTERSRLNWRLCARCQKEGCSGLGAVRTVVNPSGVSNPQKPRSLESDTSAYFGPTMIAIGAGKHVSPELVSYLMDEFSKQPLHQKLMALWASVLDAKLKTSLETVNLEEPGCRRWLDR